MDERLEKALDFSKYRVSIENRRKAIKRRFDTMQVVHYNNGMFCSDEITISFVDTLIRNGYADAILLDKKSNPVTINDLSEFRQVLLDSYFAATNEYNIEIQKLAKARSVRKAMEW